MLRGLYLAPFNDLADPRSVVSVAVAAEDAGWDGIFLWDHMWRPPDRASSVGDVWVTLAAVAARTSRLRIGPMVVPLARRRPHKVARESVALDHLSNGRLTLGVGLGVNTGGELERFGEVTDDATRGDVLDEALAVLVALWSGDVLHHRGEHFTAADVQFHPTPLQRPRIPLWGAAVGGGGRRPLARASTLDGIFPVGASLDQLRAMLDDVGRSRGSLTGFDVAYIEPEDSNRDALREVGVTWLLHSVSPDTPLTEVLRVASTRPQ